MGTMMVGQATAFAPNYNKAVLASARVFKLLDRRPLIDGDGQSGLRLVRVFVVDVVVIVHFLLFRPFLGFLYLVYTSTTLPHVIFLTALW